MHPRVRDALVRNRKEFGMAWQQVQKRDYFGENRLPKGWQEYPCIRINKSQVTLNKSFMETFGRGKIKGMFLLFDEERHCVGFKVPNGEEDGWFTIQHPKDKGKPCFMQIAQKILKKFPEALGNVYRAHLNPEYRIIEIEISPNNMVK